jgi:hypothetical protein
LAFEHYLFCADGQPSVRVILYNLIKEVGGWGRTSIVLGDLVSIEIKDGFLASPVIQYVDKFVREMLVGPCIGFL